MDIPIKSRCSGLCSTHCYPDTTVYVVIIEDRYGSMGPDVFIRESDAIEFAERHTRNKEAVDLDFPLNDDMIEGGWVRYIPYGDDGENRAFVAKRQVR